MKMTTQALLFWLSLFMACDTIHGAGQVIEQPGVLANMERLLVGRWQGNEQEASNGWRQMDFYIFANDGSYVVAIRVFDPGEKKWQRPSDVIDENDGFSGQFFVEERNVLVLDNWFAPRVLNFELRERELILQRAMLDASWTMQKVRKFDWEDPEMSAKIDEATYIEQEVEGNDG